LFLCREDLFGNVFHAHQERDAKARHRYFLASIHGPIAILEIVMLIAGKGLDAAIAAMVVRHQQAFVGDYFSCASATEYDYGILIDEWLML
jgi:hypothetical protein